MDLKLLDLIGDCCKRCCRDCFDYPQEEIPQQPPILPGDQVYIYGTFIPNKLVNPINPYPSFPPNQVTVYGTFTPPYPTKQPSTGDNPNLYDTMIVYAVW